MLHEEIDDIDRDAEQSLLRQQAMWDMFEDARRRQAATLEELTEWIRGSTFRAPTNQNDLPQESATKFVAIVAVMAALAGCAVTMPLRDVPGGADDGGTYRHTPTARGGNAAIFQDRILR